MYHVRVRLSGPPSSVDLASEVFCVVSTVSRSTTYPLVDVPGHIRRYLNADFDPDVLADLRVTVDIPLLMR